MDNYIVEKILLYRIPHPCVSIIGGWGALYIQNLESNFHFTFLHFLNNIDEFGYETMTCDVLNEDFYFYCSDCHLRYDIYDCESCNKEGYDSCMCGDVCECHILKSKKE